ncbi:MAG TPA: MMPL family transporter [Burkholderiales bacterium]|nr:MMPL family transporter [Burkholderiales bacterium]
MIFRRPIVLLWCVLLALAVWIVFARTTISADLVAFLPRSATPKQQLMVDQLRDGVASRLVLFGIEGGDTPRLAAASRAFAKALQQTPHFSYVNNGEQQLGQRDRQFLFEQRYLLSHQVVPERFSVDGLRAALEAALGRLASSGGLFYQASLARDPTGEIFAVIQPLMDGSGPATREGVWFDDAGRRALLVAETHAAGFDMDAQARVQADIRAAFERVRGEDDLRLLYTGPSVFAVQSRAAIESDAWRLSMLATLFVATILLLAYRSLPLLGLGLLPVATGVLTGIAAVSLGFGDVHGITLGFGATLIGEAVDYPTYVFTQIAPGETVRDAARRVWPTLRLAVLTTVFSALAMLLSSFQGLAQLGLFSLSGVLAAGLVTRYVLPQLVSAPLRSVRALPPLHAGRIALAGWLRWTVIGALIVSAAFLATRGPQLWENDLANLNPIPQAARDLDQRMREALGAPDVRLLYAVQAPTRDEALRGAERLASRLDELKQRGLIGSYDSPAFYLPSLAAQQARQAALPDERTLRSRLAEAATGLPFQSGLFEPFISDVQQARNAPPLTPQSLAGTGLELKLKALLSESGDRWLALLPLAGVKDAQSVADASAAFTDESVFLLDLKAESNRMVRDYRNESLGLWCIGALAIAAVLWAGLRRGRAVLSVMSPVVCAVFVTAALLAAFGARLNLFHLVSLLLVLGVGMNYALFFNRNLRDDHERARNVFALLVCALTTTSAFGALAFAASPVLQSIGITVGTGAVLSLLFSALWRPAGRSG